MDRYQASMPAARHVWNRFSIAQLIVMALAAIPLAVVASVIALGSLSIIDTEQMAELALGAGENPGIIIFGAMFLASPVQWLTGRSQVRVRKYLGVVFFLLALSNGAMFVVEEGIGGALAQPFLVAGTVALAVAVPLFLTSSRWSQRALGRRRWNNLHRLTYLIAAALLLHVALIPDIGPGFMMISAGFIARIPAVRRRLQKRSNGASQPPRVVPDRWSRGIEYAGKSSQPVPLHQSANHPS